MIDDDGAVAPHTPRYPTSKSPYPVSRKSSRLFIYSPLMAGLGIFQTAGGLYLALLGGSLYYLLSGILVILAAWLLWRKDERGAWLYGLFLTATAIWAFQDAGLNFWPVIARVLLGLWLLLPYVRRRLVWQDGALQRPSPIGAWAIAIAAISVSAATAPAPHPARELARTDPIEAPTPDGRPLDWPGYGRDLAGVRYVPSTQINRENVGKLQQVWSFRTGDVLSGHPVWEMTPLQLGDSLYLCTPSRQVVAVDAQTGRLRWRFAPPVDRMPTQELPMCRGVSYHADANGVGACTQRIFSSTFSGDLWALDAKTGTPCKDFGRGGRISLLDGLGPMTTRDMVNTTPGVVVGDLIVVGGQVVDGKSTDEPSGVIRAFDVHSGTLRWAWDMGRPDRTTSPDPGQVYTRSTPNSWTSFAADPALGLVYIPTGNPAPDFFGGKRRSFDEKYSVSLVALDVATGRPRWSFQAVHHDLWDLDLPAQPILIDWPGPGGVIPAIVEMTKTGDIFVLDRRFGKPLVPVREVPVPQTGGVAEDRLSPTQPVSALSLAPPIIREKDMWGVTPFDQLLCRITFRSARYDGPFTPPGLTSAIGFPATSGTFSWSGASFDPVHRILIANMNNVPWITRLIPRSIAAAKGKKTVLQEYGLLGQLGTPYLYSTRAMLSVLGMPCMQPPWGELVAIDMNTQRVMWRKPFGTVRDNGPFGMASHLPFRMGVPNAGGSIITAGGLAFIGATTDRYFRAFDIRDSRELWRRSLPAGANATPIS